MAYQLPAGTDAGFIAAHNEQHRAVVGLENATSHYDGPEYVLNVEQVPGAAPTTLAEAVNTANSLKSLLNDHYGRHNGGSGKKIYAHKVVDAANPIVTAAMDAGSVHEAALLASLVTLVTELQTRFIAHIANLKPDGTASGVHAAADTVNILGATPTMTTYSDVAEALNNLKAQYNAHIASAAGGSPHPNADSSNPVTAANADVANLDTLVTLANQIRTKYGAHRTQASVHSVDDTFNTVGGSAVSYPAGLFTLATELRSSYEAHRASTTYHDQADSSNTISASAPSTIAQLIALMAEMATDVTAHFRRAPTSRAVR